MTKQELIECLAEQLTYEDIELADAEAKAYAKGFKEGLEARTKVNCSFDLCNFNKEGICTKDEIDMPNEDDHIFCGCMDAEWEGRE